MENDYYDNLIAYSYDDYVEPKEEEKQEDLYEEYLIQKMQESGLQE